MGFPIIDKRLRTDILNEIRDMSASYMPEWRYDEDKPDAGVALSFIWADMLSETISKLNQTPYNHKMALLNALNATPQPAQKAVGYVSFEVSSDTLIKGGFKLTSKAQEPYFVTTEDLYASISKIIAVYAVGKKNDALYKYKNLKNIKIFDFAEKNKRYFTIEHDFILDISKTGCVEIEMDFGQDTYSTLHALLSYTLWEYLVDDTWISVKEIKVNKNRLKLDIESSRAVRFHITESKIFEKIKLDSIYLYAHNNNLKPDVIYSNDIEQIMDGFYPFGENFTLFDQLAVACDEAFSKPGAKITVSFVLKTEDFETEGYITPEIKLKPLMKLDEVLPPEPYIISVSGIIFEYFNGNGWAALNIENNLDLSVLKKKGESRINIKFEVPKDMDSILVGAHEKRFVRIRITGINNAYRLFAFYRSPYVEDIKINYSFSKGVSPKKLSTTQNMKSQELDVNKTPIPLIYNQFEKSAMYLAFNEPITIGNMYLSILNDNIPLDLVWEYYTKKGWQTLDVFDETRNFQCSGRVHFSTTEPCVLHSLFGRSAYFVRITDISGGMEEISLKKPIVLDFWYNVVRVKCVEDGAKGNIPAGELVKILEPQNNVEAVLNPFETFGGSDIEKTEDVIKRYSNKFSHGERAVTRSDYEHLIREVSPKIIKCRVFSNTNSQGLFEHGKICAVVLHCDYKTKSALEEGLIKQIHGHLSSRNEITKSFSDCLSVILPMFITFEVMAYILIDNPEMSMWVQNKAAEKIEEFIDPVTGNFQRTGFAIGTVPDSHQIAKALKTIPEISAVLKVDIIYTRAAKEGNIPIEAGSLRNLPFILPQSGRHKVIVKR